MFTEGIADYVRFKLTFANEGTGSLPEYSAKQYYKNIYRITAHFLAWNNGFVVILDKIRRKATYKVNIRKEKTGESLYNYRKCIGKTLKFKL
ncbi:hypothetical protein APR41_14015 [Salegentibacter salinarum]|uniref:Uncharacterized protein n=1 Tax=Salegentibacter salinarum TaxID=447422 RepID=A0A2N0U061_9FLAO|nr:hypothetical protein APR41_14015 [Salegentibacter salinarum]